MHHGVLLDGDEGRGRSEDGEIGTRVLDYRADRSDLLTPAVLQGRDAAVEDSTGEAHVERHRLAGQRPQVRRDDRKPRIVGVDQIEEGETYDLIRAEGQLVQPAPVG